MFLQTFDLALQNVANGLVAMVVLGTDRDLPLLDKGIAASDYDYDDETGPVLAAALEGVKKIITAREERIAKIREERSKVNPTVKGK